MRSGIRIGAAILAPILAFMLTCCQGGTVTGLKSERTVCFTDASGCEVVLERMPERVAVLFSSFADIWVSAGGRVDITVGETVERGFAAAPDDDSGNPKPEPTVSTPILVDEGAGHSTIDIERLIAAEPSLVIGTADYECQRAAVEACRRVGIPAILLRVESFFDYLDALTLFCELTEKPERVELLGTAVAAEIERIKAEFSLDGASYLLIRTGASSRSTKPKTSEESFVCRMLDELGGTNIANSAQLGQLSLEAILSCEPDYLFITTMGNESAAIEHMDSLLTSAVWRELDCVRSGKYAYLPRELFHFKPNSRWAQAYEYLVRLCTDGGLS